MKKNDKVKLNKKDETQENLVQIDPQNYISPYEGENYKKVIEQLAELRRDGENKAIAIRNEIRDISLNKQLDKKTRKQLINSNIEQLKLAKKEAKKNRKQIKHIIKRTSLESKLDFKRYFIYVKAKAKQDKIAEKKFYKQLRKSLTAGHAERVKQIKSHSTDQKTCKVDLKAESISYSAKVNEAKVARNDAIEAAKQFKYNAFMNKYGFNAILKNDKHSLSEKIKFKYEHYIANFNIVNWLIKNALYMLILIVFAVLIITTNGGLISGESLLTAAVQIAPKIFFALGVGGLILLGGTDLSIGRLTGVGVSFTLMLLSSDVYADNKGIVWFNITSAPPALKIVSALLASIIICTLFTSFAGFFTAKFKMHPFISTLAVQLISYGMFQIFWSATSSFIPDDNLLGMLRGPQSIFLVIYAVVAIIAVWFIWNKTKFGKHIYAVGGNQEAATVSGINPFVITLLAFVMAGILYGFGGFVQAIQTGTGNFNSGYGTETDAIAACVIGGISFSGGVGKVSGAVIGAIILGFLTHAFAYIGVNSNLQLLIKGVIILMAVALDCVKYLKKK